MYDSNRNFGQGCATADGIGMDTRAMLGSAPIQQTKSGEVQSELDSLEKALNELHSEVDALIGRLQPVSNPAPTGNGCDTSPAPVGCYVSARIQTLRMGIHAAANRLRVARDELAI